jgi:hypothetical protein
MHYRYKVFYYDQFPLKRLDMKKFTHMLHNGTQSGGMKEDDFLKLKKNIKENGMTNPIVVEVGARNYCYISIGNNRAEVMEQLGETHLAAILVFRTNTPLPEDGDCTRIDPEKLVEELAILHPSDDTWKMSHWIDKLLKDVRNQTYPHPWMKNF